MAFLKVVHDASQAVPLFQSSGAGLLLGAFKEILIVTFPETLPEVLLEFEVFEELDFESPEVDFEELDFESPEVDFEELDFESDEVDFEELDFESPEAGFCWTACKIRIFLANLLDFFAGVEDPHCSAVTFMFPSKIPTIDESLVIDQK